MVSPLLTQWRYHSLAQSHRSNGFSNLSATPHVLISDATSHSQFAPPQYLHIANNLSNRSKRELDSLWPSYKIWHEVNTESCHDATFDITDVIMTTPSATSDVIVAIIITPTPYMVLPLFATRFAAYTGGIRVSFMHPRLFQFDTKCSAWEIYHTDLHGWNL